MIYSNQFITRKTYFNNYLATAAMVPFLSDFSGSFCYFLEKNRWSELNSLFDNFNQIINI